MEIQFEGIPPGAPDRKELRAEHFHVHKKRRGVGVDHDRHRVSRRQALAPDEKHARHQIADRRKLDHFPLGGIFSGRNRFAQNPESIRLCDDLGFDRQLGIGFELCDFDGQESRAQASAGMDDIKRIELAGEAVRAPVRMEKDFAAIVGNGHCRPCRFDFRPPDPELRLEGPHVGKSPPPLGRQQIPPAGMHGSGEKKCRREDKRSHAGGITGTIPSVRNQPWVPPGSRP